MAGYARILLCGEGAHDIGFDPTLDSRTGRHVDQEGWLQPLIRLLADEDAYLEFARWRVRDAAAISGGKEMPRDLRGHGPAAYNAMGKAVREDFDILVFMVDNDTPSRRDRAKWSQYCRDIWAGFRAAKDPICAVACIPISASEAWLLADAEAWRQLGLKDAMGLPGNRAETIWGQRGDPDGERPHEYFARICGQAQREDDIFTRSSLAEQLNPDTLRKHCPDSFTPFAHSMQACLAKHGCLHDFDHASIPANWCTP